MEKNSEFVSLTEEQKSVFEKLLSAPIKCSDVLLRQITSAAARIIDENGSLEIRTTEPERAKGCKGAIVTGIQADYDTVKGYGPYVNYVLVVHDGVITYLDVYKDDGAPVRTPPDPTSFELICKAESDRSQ